MINKWLFSHYIFLLWSAHTVCALEDVSSNIFLRGGDHTGLYCHTEIGLIESSTAKSEFKGEIKTLNPGPSINIGLGYSLIPKLVAHVNVDVYTTPPGGYFPIFIRSFGPGITWYTPFANTFLTGNIYSSHLDRQGGDASLCNRWRLGLGKEIMLYEHYGIGLSCTYEGGKWSADEAQAPTWSLSGVRMALSFTYN
jgi:hypothetical protein